MSILERDISNISYTEKDFQSIFPALLDLVKKLTYKWDPSISNESDPGVVLLKLNAIIADKCNYNIDKNVLETFPISVTQERNARQLFEQLGYSMQWYKGATTNVTLKWIDEKNKSEVPVTIPRFTMVTDYDNTVIYTLTDEISFRRTGVAHTCPAIQGVVVKYDINGEEVITTANLDSNRRIYFNDMNVAENGVFINNVGQLNFSSWKKKDNLLVEQLGNTFYKFGVSQDGNVCYLEFPEDSETMFGTGIEIHYIKTDGYSGNIAARVLEKFYNDLSVIDNETESTLQLTAENVSICNYSSATDGDNPESIDSAYKHYKRRVGTFDTLVTLRDYFNAICNTERVSNCFVCDRTNDIQSSYSIMSNISGINQATVQIEEDADGNQVMNAFNLKLYMLDYYDGDVNTIPSYEKTFTLIENGSDLEATITELISDYKSLQHDYMDIIPGKICMFKNKYPIIATIIPEYKLTTAESSDVVLAVKKALYSALNAREVSFGSDLSYDYICEVIENADARIKSAVLADITYDTYAVYKDCVLSGYNEVLISSGDESDELSIESNFDSLVVNTDAFVSKFGYTSETFVFNWTGSTWLMKYDNRSIDLGKDVAVLLPYGISCDQPLASESGSIVISIPESYIRKRFRTEIYAKSVLAGKTQLLNPDSNFRYSLDQVYVPPVMQNVAKITTAAEVTLSTESHSEELDNSLKAAGISVNSAVYTAKENESIILTAPSLIDSVVYSNYVKCLYLLGVDSSGSQRKVGANTDYQLQAGDNIIFFWKDSDEDAAYSYCRYKSGDIINATFEMNGTNMPTTISENLDTLLATELSSENGTTIIDSELTTTVSSLYDSKCILSGTKKVTIRIQNKTVIRENNLDTAYYFYWILNRETTDVTGRNVYRLFNYGGDREYTLQSDEYFMYTTAAKAELIILGAGTKISVRYIADNWEVPVMNYSAIVSDGLAAFDDSAWYTLPNGAVLTIQEMQFYAIASGSTLVLEPKDESLTDYKVAFKPGALYPDEAGEYSENKTEVTTLDGDPLELTLDDFNIYYKDATTSSEYTLVPPIAVENASWEATTSLSIAASSDKAQQLADNHTFIFYDEEENELGRVTGKSVMLSANTYQGGGEYISVLVFSEEGYYTPISAYVFDTEPSTTYIKHDEYGNTVFIFSIDDTLAPSQTDKSITFRLPAGDYVLPVTKESSNIASLYVSLDNNKLGIIQDEDITQLEEFKKAYLHMTLPDADNDPSKTYELKVHVEKTDLENAVVSIPGAYKYDKPDLAEDLELFTRRFNKLIELDFDKTYDYTYVVDPDEVIHDPCSAEAFLDVGHIFNEYTICQLDTSANSKTDIRVTSRIRS